MCTILSRVVSRPSQTESERNNEQPLCRMYFARPCAVLTYAATNRTSILSSALPKDPCSSRSRSRFAGGGLKNTKVGGRGSGKSAGHRRCCPYTLTLPLLLLLPLPSSVAPPKTCRAHVVPTSDNHAVGKRGSSSCHRRGRTWCRRAAIAGREGGHGQTETAAQACHDYKHKRAVRNASPFNDSLVIKPSSPPPETAFPRPALPSPPPPTLPYCTDMAAPPSTAPPLQPRYGRSAPRMWNPHLANHQINDLRKNRPNRRPNDLAPHLGDPRRLLVDVGIRGARRPRRAAARRRPATALPPRGPRRRRCRRRPCRR
jgi:hypothetical protein